MGDRSARRSGPAAGAAADTDAYWNALTTVALLGTDRRDPPVPPPGPIADVVADSLRGDPAGRMLAAVSAVAALRRAAFVPLGPAAPLVGPEIDERRRCPAAAVACWREVVSEWPVFEDEWLLRVIDARLALPADVVVDLLVRHRSDPVRRARVVAAAGPVAGWLEQHVPSLASPGRRARPVDVAPLADLPLPAELADLVDVDGETLAERLVDDLDSGGDRPQRRALWVNLLARCRPSALPEVAAALESRGDARSAMLARGARLRNRMVAELTGEAGPTHP